MVQVEFLKFQNQVNKRVNPNSNLPCKKTQTYAQIIWCVSNDFECFPEGIVTYRIVRNPAITTDRNL